MNFFKQVTKSQWILLLALYILAPTVSAVYLGLLYWIYTEENS